MRLDRFFMLFLTLCAVVSVSASTDDDLALSQYPSSLVESFKSWAGPDATLTKSVATTRVGAFLIAAYSNGLDALVRVFHVDGTSLSIVQDLGYPYAIVGSRPSVKAVDLDGDGAPEVIVSLSVTRATEDWIFRLGGDGHLQPIGPTRTKAGVISSSATDARYEDIDGDGKLELLVPPASHTSETAIKTYRLTAEGYVPTPTRVFFTDFFARTTASPDEFETTFQATTGEKYVIRVVNGIGAKAVTSARVSINDKEVFGPSDFKPTQRTSEAAFVAEATNHLIITIAGAPGSEMRLVVLHQ